MKQEIDDMKSEVQELSRRTKGLQRWVFILWPLIWLTSSLAILLTTRADAASTKVLIKWVESRGLTVLIIAVLIGAIAFIAKLSFDFRHRGERFSLNPGSRPK